MGKLVYFADYKKDNQITLTGEASCANCNHRFITTQKSENFWIICPKCGKEKALFNVPIDRDIITKCICGNTAFNLIDDRYVCDRCST